jgi:hypothetical protein
MRIQLSRNDQILLLGLLNEQLEEVPQRVPELSYLREALDESIHG